MKTSRRESLQQSAAISLAPLPSPKALAAVSAERSAREVVLENGRLGAVFDATSGALVELSNKRTGRRFQGRRELAHSFVMVVSLPERVLHVIDGIHQKTSSNQSLPHRLELTWDGLEIRPGTWVFHATGRVA